MEQETLVQRFCTFYDLRSEQNRIRTIPRQDAKLELLIRAILPAHPLPSDIIARYLVLIVRELSTIVTTLTDQIAALEALTSATHPNQGLEYLHHSLLDRQDDPVIRTFLDNPTTARSLLTAYFDQPCAKAAKKVYYNYVLRSKRVHYYSIEECQQIGRSAISSPEKFVQSFDLTSSTPIIVYVGENALKWAIFNKINKKMFRDNELQPWDELDQTSISHIENATKLPERDPEQHWTQINQLADQELHHAVKQLLDQAFQQLAPIAQITLLLRFGLNLRQQQIFDVLHHYLQVSDQSGVSRRIQSYRLNLLMGMRQLWEQRFPGNEPEKSLFDRAKDLWQAEQQSKSTRRPTQAQPSKSELNKIINQVANQMDEALILYCQNRLSALPDGDLESPQTQELSLLIEQWLKTATHPLK